jgi:hypothetical protein
MAHDHNGVPRWSLTSSFASQEDTAFPDNVPLSAVWHRLEAVQALFHGEIELLKQDLCANNPAADLSLLCIRHRLTEIRFLTTLVSQAKTQPRVAPR